MKHMERFQTLNSEAGNSIAEATKSRKCRKCGKYHPVKPRETCPVHTSLNVERVAKSVIGRICVSSRAMTMTLANHMVIRTKNDDDSHKSSGYKKRTRKKKHKCRVQAVREQQESSSDEPVM